MRVRRDYRIWLFYRNKINTVSKEIDFEGVIDEFATKMSRKVKLWFLKMSYVFRSILFYLILFFFAIVCAGKNKPQDK